MNRISEEKEAAAIGLFCDGESIRSVCQKVRISRETAHRIQKLVRHLDLSIDGLTKVLAGKRRDGSISFYYTREARRTWEGPRSKAADWGLKCVDAAAAKDMTDFSVVDAVQWMRHQAAQFNLVADRLEQSDKHAAALKVKLTRTIESTKNRTTQ